MTNAEARFNNSLRPRKPEGSLGLTAQDGHLTLTQLLNYDFLEVVGFKQMDLQSGLKCSG